MPNIDNVMLYSGGMDSTVLLYKLKPNVKALLFDYGQRHRKELLQALVNCQTLQIEHEMVDLSRMNNLIAKGSQAGNDPVPLGHYAEDSMKQTIVPNRNSIMLSIAVGHAITIGASHVWFAAHAGDHAIYPDCRPEFVAAFDRAMVIGNEWTPVVVEAPFIYKTKAQIVELGAELHVPFERTWSCYQGGEFHCGRCGTCVERKEAFAHASVFDPTRYEGGTNA